MNLARYHVMIVLALLAGILFCYGQIRHFGFVNLDDTVYVVDNSMVRSGLTGDGIRWAFTTTEGANWHPLTWLSLMLDSELYGSGPGGYHLTNLILHAANAILLFGILIRMTGAVWPSAFVAGFFAVHPLHVESVAWISERKDVLSTFWGFLAIGCYAAYGKHRHKAAFWGAFSCLFLGLMAKPMLVTWPFLFLMLDYWPLQRLALPESAGKIPWRRLGELLIEKIPFFMLAAFFCWTTLMAQADKGAVLSIKTLPLADRLGNAALSYMWYIGKMLWPAGLNVYYIHRGPSPGMLGVAGAALLIAGFSTIAFRTARRYPFVPVGWFWYLGTLVPVIGLVQVGLQAQADRYAYIPMIGIYIIVAWGATAIARNHPWHRRMLFTAALIVLVILGMKTAHQASFWMNSETLFRRALHIDPMNDLAHNNLGTALEAKGNTREAAEHYRRAVQLNPWNHPAWNNLANTQASSGNISAALQSYQKAIALSPHEAAYRYNFGKCLLAAGKSDEAFTQLAEALRIRPEFAEVYNLMGRIFENRGDNERALKFYTKALEARPDDPAAIESANRIRQGRP